MSKPHNIASFMLRFTQELWRDPHDEPHVRWRGHIRHVQGDEEERFTDFAEAVSFMQRFLTRLTMDTFAGATDMSQDKVFFESFKLWNQFATSYAENLLPYFAGKSVKHHQGEPSDYVLNYIRQIQNGYPYPEYWQYYKARQPVFQLAVDGIDYLWLYHESSLIQVRDTFFGKELELKAYTLDTRLLEPGKTAKVTLIWRVGSKKPPEAMVHMQLVNDQGKVWGEASPEPVLDPAGPSPVEGHYQLTVSSDAPRFDGHLQLSVMDANGQSLGGATVGQIPVRQTSLPPTAVTLPIKNLGDQISLIGYQVSASTVTPGDAIEVTLYWQAQVPINFDFTVFTHLIGPDASLQGQHDAQPVNGQLPTSQWTVGEVVADLHSFTVAPEAPPGSYELVVGMYRWDTGERLPILSDDNNGKTAITLTSVTVE